jgi:cytochrome c oxidase subunit 2
MIGFLNAIENIITGFSGLATEGADGGFWLPSQSSTIAPKVDLVWNIILAINVIFFALIVVLAIRFVIKYRSSRGLGTESSRNHNTVLEITWTVLPTLLMAVLFWIGFKTYIDMRTPPQNAYEVHVTGQKWQWLFTYNNGYVDENLHVPVDTDVVLTMTSEDVIHSLFIPAFRTKQDVVPGRYTKIWFNAVETGEFTIYCAEFCGTSHSDMLAKVIVHEKDEFEPWMKEASNLHGRFSPVEVGELYFKRFGCKQCHSLDGKTGIGPTFKGMFGRTEQLTDGSTITVDENFIRESILDPQAKVANGYNPVMPTFQGRFNEQDITAIIEFIKNID